MSNGVILLISDGSTYTKLDIHKNTPEFTAMKMQNTKDKLS